MTISNETKIGLMAVVGIVLLILGFNFLKGKDLFKPQTKMYVVYKDVLGLANSNPVVINGVKVGKILQINGGTDLKNIIVTLAFTQKVRIPRNSVAVINPNLFGSPSLEIQLGDATDYLNNGDTLTSSKSGRMLEEAMKEINPVLYEARIAVRSMDSVIHAMRNVFDYQTQKNLRETFANLNTISENLAANAQTVKQIMDPKKGQLINTLDNLQGFTSNLKSNNQRLDSILGNVNQGTAKFAALNLKQSVDSLNIAIDNLKQGIEKVNNGNGTLGLLLNDGSLYHRLISTTNKLNILIDDLRAHPKRYVNFSIFGKKDKGNYLTAPLVDDTLKAIKQ